MTGQNAEERISESIFEDMPEPTGEERETRCLACRVWWKVAIVLVLVAAVAGIIANKQRGNDLPKAAPAATGAGNQSAQDQGPVAHGGAEENTSGPDTVLATVNGGEIALAELEKALRDMPEQYRAAFKNNQHELLEQLITRELLLQEARSSAASTAEELEKPQQEAAGAERPDEDRLIDALLKRDVLEEVDVSEADIREFYEQHKDEMPAGRTFEELKDSLRDYALQEKQSEAVEAYLAKLREAASIHRNEEWVDAQKARAADNPLDRALAIGRPVLADFGRGKCIPCKMMKPILDDLKEEYAGRAEILIIEIDEYPAVTQRVGIRAIPTQIFYDAEGNEVYRHQGFMPREAIVEKLREMGVE